MTSIISLRHLRSFVAVADTGSFTRAADRLFLTQSSLSATINQLEQEIGVKLFERTTRKVTLTQPACHLHQQAAAVLVQFDALVSDLKTLALHEHGQLRLAAVPSVIAWLLAPSLPKFQAACPGVTLSVREGGTAEIERRVRDGEADFGLTSRLEAYEGLDYAPLLKDRYGVVCSVDHPLARTDGPVPWQEVAAHQRDLVTLTSDTTIGKLHRDALRHLELGGAREEVSSSASIYPILCLGGRISILPRLTASAHQLDSLPWRPLSDPDQYRELFLVTRSIRSISTTARRLLDALQDTLASRPLPDGLVPTTLHALIPLSGHESPPDA